MPLWPSRDPLSMPRRWWPSPLWPTSQCWPTTNRSWWSMWLLWPLPWWWLPRRPTVSVLARYIPLEQRSILVFRGFLAAPSWHSLRVHFTSSTLNPDPPFVVTPSHFHVCSLLAFPGMNTYRMLKLFRRHASYLNNQYRKLRPDEDDINDDDDDAGALDLDSFGDYYTAYWVCDCLTINPL